LTATDAISTERTSIPGTAADTATFLVTRTGDASKPLTVFMRSQGHDQHDGHGPARR
jgi:hypothetical protein